VEVSAKQIQHPHLVRRHPQRLVPPRPLAVVDLEHPHPLLLLALEDLEHQPLVLALVDLVPQLRRHRPLVQREDLVQWRAHRRSEFPHQPLVGVFLVHQRRPPQEACSERLAWVALVPLRPVLALEGSEQRPALKDLVPVRLHLEHLIQPLRLVYLEIRHQSPADSEVRVALE
jgi:hypothetical protein